MEYLLSQVSLVLIIAAAAMGFIRGLAGFGTAMVFMPIALLQVSIGEALVLLFSIGVITQLPFLPRCFRQCNWQEMIPMVVGASIAMPVGLTIVLYLDRELVRVGVAVVVLILVAMLMAGVRYHKQISRPQSVGVGLFAGITGGMSALYGPILSIFWIGGAHNDSQRIRANFLTFFALMGIVESITFAVKDLFTVALLMQALWLIPISVVTMALGTFAFRFTSERGYRFIAYSLCIFAALSNLLL